MALNGVSALPSETSLIEAEVLIQRIIDVTQCAICLNTYCQPKSLACLHTFCRDCLRNTFTDAKDGACPLCRSNCPFPDGKVENLPDNFFMHNLLEAKSISTQLINRTKLCDICCEASDNPEQNPDKLAQQYCGSCRQYQCRSCSLWVELFIVHIYYLIKFRTILWSQIVFTSAFHIRLDTQL